MDDNPLNQLEDLTAPDRLKYLYFVSQKISEKKPLSELLQEIMESSKKLMNAEASSLLLYDEKENKLDFHVTTGAKGELIKQYSVCLGEGISGWVAEHRESLLIDDCYKDSRFNSAFDKKSDFRTRSMICVPLLRQDTLLGVMQVINKKEGGVFSKEDLVLFETLASQCAIAIMNHYLTVKQIETESLEHELKIAREIQQNLLPESLPPYTDIDIAHIIIPAKQVGGDYFNIIKLNDNYSLFLVADVSGKSVSAALIVSTIDASLNCYLKSHRESFELLSFVNTLNKVLIETTTITKFATCWLGLYDHEKSEMVSINAGHNPPYFYCSRNSELTTFDKGGVFLGAVDMPYETELVNFNKDDLIVVFTDGVTEAWNKDEEDFGEDRLIDIIQKNSKMTAIDMLEKIQEAIKEYVGDAPQNDDITCIVIKKN